jgi:hypothetical protein
MPNHRYLEEALILGQQSVALFPNNILARNGLTTTLRQLGRREEALALVQETVARFPDNVVARNLAASLLSELGKLNEALAFQRTTVARFPDHSLARDVLATILQELDSRVEGATLKTEDRGIVVRRELLQEIYDRYMKSPTAYIGWDRDDTDPDSIIRIREAQWLHEHGLITGTFGATGNFMVRLTVKGRDFVEGGGLALRADPVDGSSRSEETGSINKPAKEAIMNGIKVFISHSAKDASLAKAFVDCLEACIEVPDRAIRCTSVPGYKLAPGDVSDSVLRDNLEHCSVVIGLLTDESLSSGYVIMELGAAWGLNKTTCALLAPSVVFGRMPGPLSRLHAIKTDSDHDIASLMEVIAEKTGFPMRNRGKSTAAVSAFVVVAQMNP